jgi:hypothetical protein
MKNRDSKLDRLFAAARSAPVPAVEEMPARLQARVLAHWRSGPDEDAGWLSLTSLCRTALVCAGLAMLLCVAWNQFDPAPVDYSAYASTDAPGEESVNALHDELIP